MLSKPCAADVPDADRAVTVTSEHRKMAFWRNVLLNHQPDNGNTAVPLREYQGCPRFSLPSHGE